MILAARIILTGLWLWAFLLMVASGSGGASVQSQGTLLYLALLLLVSLPLAAVWTPYIAGGLFGGLVESMNDDPADRETLLLAKWARWAEAREKRRLVVLLCWWEGVMVHPNLQRPFHTGMRHARRGSWLEWFFAQEVLRFGDARNVMEALTVLERHGIAPRTHWSSHISEMMSRRRSRKSPEKPPLVLPETPKDTAAPTRNPRIKLFASADGPPALPPAPPRSGELADKRIDPAELGPEAGQVHRAGLPHGRNLPR